MSEYKRLTTEEPLGNYQYLHNMTKIIDKWVYLREFEDGKDLNLIDYCKKECKERCNSNMDAPAEEFAEYMDCECPVSLLFGMAVGHAELRHHLAQYEDIGSPEEFAKLKAADGLPVIKELPERFQEFIAQRLDEGVKK